MGKCKNCSTQTENKSYCCRKCYNNRGETGISIHSDDYRVQLSNKLKEEHKNRSEEDRQVWKNKIGEGNRKKLSEAEYNLLYEVLVLKYCRGYEKISVHTGLSKKVIERFIKEDENLKQLHENTPTFVNVKIQTMPPSIFANFKEDITLLGWDKLSKKYDVSEKVMRSFCKKHKLTLNRKSPTFKKTLPEKIVESILTDLKVNFASEKYMSRSYRCDFVVDKVKIIEVQGDYWHGNPLIYDECDLNPMQKRNKARDKRKYDLAKSNGYSYLEIWEYDIKNNLEQVKNKIKEYVKKE